MFVCVFWRQYRQERPPWAKIRARVILTQKNRVRLGRNHEWRDLLRFTTDPYASGLRFETVPFEHVPPAPTPKKPIPEKKPQRSTKVKSKAQKRKKPVLDSGESDEESIAPPPKRQRKEMSMAADAKAAELAELSCDISDGDFKKWVQQNYPNEAKSISFTSRRQTLYILASLLPKNS